MNLKETLLVMRRSNNFVCFPFYYNAREEAFNNHTNNLYPQQIIMYFDNL